MPPAIYAHRTSSEARQYGTTRPEEEVHVLQTVAVGGQLRVATPKIRVSKMAFSISVWFRGLWGVAGSAFSNMQQNDDGDPPSCGSLGTVFGFRNQTSAPKTGWVKWGLFKNSG